MVISIVFDVEDTALFSAVTRSSDNFFSARQLISPRSSFARPLLFLLSSSLRDRRVLLFLFRSTDLLCFSSTSFLLSSSSSSSSFVFSFFVERFQLIFHEWNRVLAKVRQLSPILRRRDFFTSSVRHLKGFCRAHANRQSFQNIRFTRHFSHNKIQFICSLVETRTRLRDVNRRCDGPDN